MSALKHAATAMAVSANDIGLSAPRKGYGHGGSQRRFEAVPARGHKLRLADDHPAIAEGQSLFQARVYDPADVPRLLIDGHNSRKIGRRVAKGHWRGFPIFTLTLEERKTCPTSCAEWRTCYGNSMNWARRIRHGRAFEHRLWQELTAKQVEHPRGFVVRLHVLGDFYSLDYALIWSRALAEFPALRVFGYTAHGPETEIGALINALRVAYRGRFAYRFSGLDAAEGGSVVIERDTPTDHVVCPAQTGGTDCCATCALCWHSERTIAFWRH